MENSRLIIGSRYEGIRITEKLLLFISFIGPQTFGGNWILEFTVIRSFVFKILGNHSLDFSEILH